MDSIDCLENQFYKEEIRQSIYWQHRGQFHRKFVDKNDQCGIQASIDNAARKIIDADAILFVTGAGIGVDMGLADFRSSQSFWRDLNHPEIHRYEDFSDAKWFEEDPALAWGVNMHQIELYRTANVHGGYLAMLELTTMKCDFYCFTSNIDGVLQRAGFDENRVREVHGNIHRLQCLHYKCLSCDGSRDTWEDNVDISYDKNLFKASGPYPLCRNCSGIARPNVWFCHDGNYVQSVKTAEVSSQYTKWLDDLAKFGKSLCVLEIGCGLVIPTGRIESELVCEQVPHATLIRINPFDFMVPDSTSCEGNIAYEAIGIPLGAKEGMNRVLQSIKQHL